MIRMLNSYWKPFRFILVFFTGFFIALLTIYLNAFYLTTVDAKNTDSIGIMFISMGIISAGILGAIFFCKLIHNWLAFEGTVRLSKVLRITEAMALLHAKSNKEKIHAIKQYCIKIYKVNQDLGAEPVDDIDAREISGFHSWLFNMNDKSRYLGYERICCNFDDIQNIIKENQEKWGSGQVDNETLTKGIDSLKSEIASLESKKNDFAGKYTAACGREARLQKEIEGFYQHLSILIKLVMYVINNYSSKKTITKAQIEERYIEIGKADGITSMPSKLRECFREAMPAELINQGGAPSQGTNSDKT